MKTNQELRKEVEKLELQKRILELEFEIKQYREGTPLPYRLPIPQLPPYWKYPYPPRPWTITC